MVANNDGGGGNREPSNLSRSGIRKAVRGESPRRGEPGEEWGWDSDGGTVRGERRACKCSNLDLASRERRRGSEAGMLRALNIVVAVE